MFSQLNRLVLTTFMLTWPRFTWSLLGPAIPAMASAKQLPIAKIQLLIAIHMIFGACSKTLVGLLSSSQRLSLIIIGCCLSVLGAWLSITARDANSLLVAWSIMGLGYGTYVLVYSMMHDWFSQQALRQFSADLSIIISFVLPLSPWIGGVVFVTLGLSWLFVIIGFGSANILVFLWLTHQRSRSNSQAKNPSSLTLTQTIQQLKQHPTFIRVGLQNMFASAGSMIWVLGFPIFFVEQLRWQPDEYGLTWTMVSFTAGMAGALSNRWLIKRCSIDTIINAMTAVLICAGLALFFIPWDQSLRATGLLTCLWVYMCAITFLWSNFTAKAFDKSLASGPMSASIYGLMANLGLALAAMVCASISFATVQAFATAITLTHLAGLALNLIPIFHEKASS